MLLNEVLVNENTQLSEIDFKRTLTGLATAGAIGAGVLGYTGNKLSNIQPNITSIEKNIEIPSSDEPDSGELKINDKEVLAGGMPHPSFPETLVGQSQADKNEKVRVFKETFLPVIRKVNGYILANRNHLRRMLDPRYQATQLDIDFVLRLAEQYDVKIYKTKDVKKTLTELVKELLYKVDIIPEQLIIAKAALESGWGTSDLARQSNNFFGLKATFRHEPRDKIKNLDRLDYRAYHNLAHSIQSYIHNINTHKAYEKLRRARYQYQQQKNSNSELLSRQLTNYLEAYSSSPEYASKLREILGMLQRVK